MLGTYSDYRLATQNMERTLERVRAEPLNSRETEYYLETIGTIKNAEDFVKDDRVFRYAMRAFGLDDMNYAKAFMRKVLDEGVSDRDSFANRLPDKRYRDFAKTFDFEGKGDKATETKEARQGVVDNYMRQTLELDKGESNEGVRLALYFERKASSIETPMQILADKAVYKVVRTVLGLPDSFAALDIDRQAEVLAERFDVAELKDPAFVEKTVQRFSAMWDMENQSAATSPIGLLFGPPNGGISQNLMLTILQAKG